MLRCDPPCCVVTRASLEDLQKKWTGLNDLVDGHPDKATLSQIQRDGHCHEVVMWCVARLLAIMLVLM